MADVKEDEISELRRKDLEHDARLDSLSSQNQAQEFKLKSQVAKDREHDFRLDSITNKNSAQDEELHRQAIKDEDHDNRFVNLEARCAYLEKQVKFLAKLLPEHVLHEMEVAPSESKCDGVARVISLVALVLSVASLLVSVLL